MSANTPGPLDAVDRLDFEAAASKLRFELLWEVEVRIGKAAHAALERDPTTRRHLQPHVLEVVLVAEKGAVADCAEERCESGDRGGEEVPAGPADAPRLPHRCHAILVVAEVVERTEQENGVEGVVGEWEPARVGEVDVEPRRPPRTFAG